VVHAAVCGFVACRVSPRYASTLWAANNAYPVACGFDDAHALVVVLVRVLVRVFSRVLLLRGRVLT
jgi:hypothetical protein